MIRLCVFLLLIIGATKVNADPSKVSIRSESIDPPNEISKAIRERLVHQVISVRDATGTVASIWLPSEIPIKKGGKDYSAVSVGALIGVLKLSKPWNDFRGNEAPAGVYTLRFAVQPKTKDHEGTAPYREFCILIPAAEDAKVELLSLKLMIEKSGKATGGTHPVVMLLEPYAKPAADPVLIQRAKRLIVGVRAKEALGFGFTLLGSAVD